MPAYDVHIEKKTYAEAVKVCKSLGRKLFEPKSSTANSKVTALAKTKGVKSIWIGIHDKTNEEKFTYESNGQPIGYKNWNSNEPNNAGRGEDCTKIIVNIGKWNDLQCDLNLPFVCEKMEGYPISMF